MFIFILQSVWLYIKELAGKDLEFDIILKFLIYVSPRIIVLVLPLTILLASIMVFGKFAENYEFAAMKSTGISLQRAMRSLSIFIFGLSIVTFFFANNVIPAAEFNFYNLRRNIAKVKPSLAIAEGQFNQVGPLVNIKVGEKSGDRGQYLKNIVIHKRKNEAEGENNSTIIAKEGELISGEDSDIIQLLLIDGHSYDEIKPKKRNTTDNTRPFVKSKFKTNTLNIDLSELNDVDFEQTESVSRYSMFNVKQLDSVIDSLKVSKVDLFKDFEKNMMTRSRLTALNFNIALREDSIYESNDVFKLLPLEGNQQIVKSALNSVKSTQQILANKERAINFSEINLNKHIIAFYDKFALAIMCIILFFVGAPLGALIKKGGLGLPIVIAVVIFLAYHFIGIFAKNSAEDGSINPIFAAWLSTLIMLPLSIYFTSRATKDRSLVDIGSLLDPLKKVLTKEDSVIKDDTSLLDDTSEAYQNLISSSNDQLINIVKNFHQYDLPQSHRNSALAILDSRGVNEQLLRFGGNLVNENYVNADRFKSNYEINSKMALITYFFYAILGVGGLILNNNGFSTLGITLTVIGALFLILFLIALIKSYINYHNFYKLLDKNKASNIIILILVGLPFYFAFFVFFNKHMPQDIKLIK